MVVLRLHLTLPLQAVTSQDRVRGIGKGEKALAKGKGERDKASSQRIRHRGRG